MQTPALSLENVIRMIGSLEKHTPYNYINSSTNTVVEIESITYPYGPIEIKRYDPSKGETSTSSETNSISMQMISRILYALEKDVPLNIDRILGASYNTRSAFESLLCHTPQFYYCYPGRFDFSEGKVKIKSGHKHILWCPDSPHELGKLVGKKLKNLEINEIPSKSVIYNALEVPPHIPTAPQLATDEDRIHLHMQMALYEIGCALSLNTYIAQNDQGMIYNGKPIIEHNHIIRDLSSEPLVGTFDGAKNAGKLIDVMWFAKLSIPAIFEVENSTGVTSGLTRMLDFKMHLPTYSNMHFVIVAPDDLADKVSREINRTEFRSLHAYYMPYSAVSELLALCQEHVLKGVTPDFLETFLDDVYEL